MEPVRRRSESDYHFGRVLGEGSFSTVYVARELESRKEYAIKVCDKAHIAREKKQEYIIREKSALLRLKNEKGIITLFCTFQSTSKLFFVLTLARNGDLLKHIAELGSLSLSCARFYAGELLVAIEGMHRNNVIHRDLKPENLLLDQQMHLLVADFGSSKILPDDYDYEALQSEVELNRLHDDDSDEETTTATRKRRVSFVGTAQYVSPEVLNGDAAHPAIDLFSYGSIVYQMLSGRFAFDAGNEYLTFQKIIKLDYEIPDDFPQPAADLVTKLLKLKPLDRIGATDSKSELYKSIRSHEFFSGIDFDTLFTSTPPSLTSS